MRQDPTKICRWTSIRIHPSKEMAQIHTTANLELDSRMDDQCETKQYSKKSDVPYPLHFVDVAILVRRPPVSGLFFTVFMSLVT